jgi:fructose-bisphosphate aldolase, class II
LVSPVRDPRRIQPKGRRLAAGDPGVGVPYKNTYDPRQWLRKAEQGMVARLQIAFDDLGSRGRSIAR